MQIIEAEIKSITEIDGKEALLTIQRVAKTCYKSYKDADDIESAKRIIRALINSGHHAMLEFYSITMNYISNVAAYKDLTRHRHGSFAIESTRYCNYSKGKYSNELKFLNPIEIQAPSEEYKIWLKAMQAAEDNYLEMAKLDAKPDQLSLILPHSTAAEFNISANLREWRHILSLRSSVAATGHARPCIKQIMDQTLELFHEKIPVIFDDLYEQYLIKKGN
jgi:thymidylate synthase (FAD)